jgi:hypothetical protein
MGSKYDELRDVFTSVAGEASFTERQHQERGRVHSDDEVHADLTAVVTAMRATYGFRSSLSDDDLAVVVRRFFAGDDDGELAARLDVSTDVVERARINLHLFRPADTDAPFDLRALQTLLDDGLSDAACAEALDVGASTVAHYRRVLAARRAALRAGDSWVLQFADVVSSAGIVTDERHADIMERRTLESIQD